MTDFGLVATISLSQFQFMKQHSSVLISQEEIRKVSVCGGLQEDTPFS